MKDLDCTRHSADFVATAECRDEDIQIAASKADHDFRHARNGTDDADSNADNARAKNQKHQSRYDPQQQAEGSDTSGRGGFGRGVFIIRLFYDIIDDGAVRRVSGC